MSPKPILFSLFVQFCLSLPLFGEAMLQYFNTPWREITRKIPELAEAGYESLWLPPPTKGSGGLSVGYDCWDRFDLGDTDQRGSVTTRYGSRQDLEELVRVAHRFGIRVYFDNVMNHNSFDVPGYNAGVPITLYRGFVPEDFHLRVTEEGFYRKWDNTRNWGDEWQVQYLGLADLIDIATEPGQWNKNFGSHEGDWIKKISFVRHPNHPEFYCYKPTAPGQKHSRGEGQYVGFGPGNGITVQDLADNADFYSELVEAMLNRAARWQLATTRCDGFRLDAVKHTPADFFGATYGEDKDTSDYGYTGQIQRQFNLTHGYIDANHRDTVFDTQKPRDDAMLFGEHLGQPPSYQGYIDAGMRLVDNELRNQLNGRLGNPSADLFGFDRPGYGGFPPGVSVMHAQSHDNDFAARRELQHAIYFTRAGLPLVYTDGNYHAETLSQSGGAFPRHANTNFLGQFADPRLPNLAYIHQHFARGQQVGRWSDADFIAYERIDKRENPAMSDTDGVTALVMVNDNYAAGIVRNIDTAFPHEAGTPNDAYLWQYASGPNIGGFYTYASDLHTHTVPPGGYFVYSWRTPEEAPHWKAAGGAPVTIYQNGERAGTVSVTRKDGPDGDPGFNPYGLPDDDPTDYAYRMEIPRVTDGANLRFVVRADGSAENILLKLDGGIDLNGGSSHSDPGLRDNPPAVSTDVFLGYEQPNFVHRQGAEKFAAADTARCQIGSPGAETYITTVGSGSFQINPGGGANPTPPNAAAFLYHDPEALVDAAPDPALPHQYEETQNSIVVWAKANTGLDGYLVRAYYTTDGTDPEGYGGEGTGTTRVLSLAYSHDAGGGSWFSGEITPKPAGQLRYKLSIFRTSAGGTPLASVFPTGPDAVSEKLGMMTVFEIPSFNAETVEFFPHNDYEKTPDQTGFVMQTGLDEGMHILRGRAFLKRPGRASLYNTFQQTFYYDAKRPEGEVVFPAEGDTLTGQTYEVVVRTDRSVEQVWYFIDDGAGPNDDANTGASNGNGVGAWAQAFEVVPNPSVSSPYPKEWRLRYVNIPSGNIAAKLQIRLVEASSAPRSTFTGTVSPADDAANWYTTLTRNVVAAGPDTRLFIAYPPQDGDEVAEGYVMKVYFSKALADGKTDEQLVDEFLVSIASRVSGTPEAAVPQDRALYSIVRDETPDYHALAFPLPNLYNGQPDFLHHIGVTHERGGVVLSAERKVKAKVVESTYLAITTPPAFDSDGRAYQVQLPAVANPTPDQRQTPVRIETDANIEALDIVWEWGQGNVSLVSAEVSGSKKIWDYLWTGVEEGYYRFRAEARASPGGPLLATQRREVTVVFRQLLPEVPNDPDDDDDGLLDADETTPKPLPDTNPETWTNGDVHVWRVFGKTNPLMPDTDGDLLPDALESGWSGIPAGQQGEEFQDTGYGPENTGAGNLKFDWDDANANGLHDPGEDSEPFTDTDGDGAFGFGTILARDTDGDGTPNFKADLDPPYFNTVPDNWNLPNYDFNRSRTEQIHGSMTDPNNPDTDGDGIQDGVEDGYNPAWAAGNEFDVLVHNGWVDGDGNTLDRNDPAKVWPNGVIDPGENWLETDPNNPDTDGDGLSDGTGEDKNGNGLVDGDANRNRTYDPGETWSETNPLSRDTDGDGLLDGWEAQNGLDPLDNGTDNLRTAAPDDGDPNQGASGDPDGDGFSNLQEQTNGTKPLVSDAAATPPARSIEIGPGTEKTVGQAVNGNEFEGWERSDLVAFDEFEGEGPNNQGGDVFPAWDGFDSSRDIVAFYARDGGADGNYYFRLDFYDLRPFAEEGNLDIYVVVDTGNTASGEAALPDEVDIITDMKWEVVVACYQSNTGRVYVDTDPSNNTTSVNQDLAAAGVVARDQNAPDGFHQAYFNAALDAVEFSISRQALLDAGWNGATPLRFQVFTTKDGTQNDGTGAGDLGGRNDIRDTIYDDWLAEDYWSAQEYIASNGKLASWMQAGADGRYPDANKCAKLVLLTHANLPLLTGWETQQKIDSGHGTGWHRSLDAHEAFGLPMTLHITPTLASAVEWARADPAAGKPWLDGPSFNRRIAAMAQTGGVELLGTTFADHMLPYFSSQFTQDNVLLAGQTLERIYATPPSNRTFWIPERVVDADVLAKVGDLGFSYAFIDQMRHFWKWQGRDTALSDDGYRINRYHGINCFLINDKASTFRYKTFDDGLPTSLRNLYHRKARSGIQDQVVVLYHHWDEMDDDANAAAYQTNLRWVAAKPWVRVVTPEQIASGQIDVTGDGAGDPWYAIDRGAPALPKTSHDWLDHATQENYDNWYLGQTGLEESLSDKLFDIRPGHPVAMRFGMQALADGLLADSAWNEVASLTTPASPLGRLARGTLHAATLLTAFHDQQNNDLSKYSTGAYIEPDRDYNPLSELSRNAQAQIRFAAIYRHVDDWAQSPPANAAAAALDVDLDGADEFVLRNDRLFAVFEAVGGRLVAAWARAAGTGDVYQVVGNFLSWPGTDTEEEGASNFDPSGAVAARRTSAFKDWFAAGPDTNAYVNDLYSVAPAGAAGWEFASSDGQVRKTITLADGAASLDAAYQLSGSVTKLFVRFGLSPNLDDLLVHGQRNLSGATDDGARVTVANTTTTATVTAALAYGADARYNPLATDRDAPGATPATIDMRNQAQTEQIEIESLATNFDISLELSAACGDCDQDGLPDAWELAHGLDPNDDGSTDPDNGPDGDPDLDGMTNATEYLLDLDPQTPDRHLFPKLVAIIDDAQNVTLDFPTLSDRRYRLWWSGDLSTWQRLGPDILTLDEPPNPHRQFTDSGPPLTPAHPSETERRFYRLEILMP